MVLVLVPMDNRFWATELGDRGPRKIGRGRLEAPPEPLDPPALGPLLRKLCEDAPLLLPKPLEAPLEPLDRWALGPLLRKLCAEDVPLLLPKPLEAPLELLARWALGPPLRKLRAEDAPLLLPNPLEPLEYVVADERRAVGAGPWGKVILGLSGERPRRRQPDRRSPIAGHVRAT